MPNRAVEIHDSILSAVSFLEHEVQLHFSRAYIHQSEGVPLRDAGSGWVQEARLHIYDAKVEGAFSEFPIDLSDGRIQIGQDILENEIPVPLDHTGAVELRLRPKWQERGIVTFTGRGAKLELIGEPRYVEEFRP